MRLSIKLCRHCTRPKQACPYRQQLTAAVNAITLPGTMMHNCPEYRKCWAIGDRIEIELFEIEGHTVGGSDEPEHEEREWVSRGDALGTIKELPFDHRGFFLVELDKPVSLCLPPLHSRGSWSEAEDTEVTLRMKHANKITLVEKVMKLST